MVQCCCARLEECAQKNINQTICKREVSKIYVHHSLQTMSTTVRAHGAPAGPKKRALHQRASVASPQWPCLVDEHQWNHCVVNTPSGPFRGGDNLPHSCNSNSSVAHFTKPPFSASTTRPACWEAPHFLPSMQYDISFQQG